MSQCVMVSKQSYWRIEVLPERVLGICLYWMTCINLGSFATATCIRCKHKVKADDIKEKVLAGDVPYCPACSTEEETGKIQYPISSPSLTSPQSPAGLHRRPSFDDEEDEYPYPADLLPVPPVLKPDIVFFGEDLPEEFHNNLELDKHNCDLLLVIGSSLRVRPVSLIPGTFRTNFNYSY